jgi:hypothetical protein
VRADETAVVIEDGANGPMAMLNQAGTLQRQKTPTFGPHVAFATGLAIMFALFVATTALLSWDVTLPAVSTTCFVLAALVALLAWRRPTQGPRLSYGDVAGAFTLIAIAAAAMAEPDQMIRLVAGADRHP